MHRTTLHRWSLAVALTLTAVAGGGAAGAQQPAPLPTAPGADKAVTTGAPPAAPASLRGYGGSPLEPWLVVWLLPISGLLSVAVATAVDRGVRARRF